MSNSAASKPPTKRSRLDRPMPAFLWNPTIWQMDRHVQRMTWTERGLYRELLDESYLRDGLPKEPADIAEMLAEKLENIGPQLDVVLQCFEVGEDGKLRNPVIEEERARQNEYRRNRASNRAHSSTYDHTCEQLRTDDHTGTGVEVEVKAKENLKPKTKAPVFDVPEWIPIPVWDSFCEMRKALRKKLTPGGAKLIIQELDKLRANGENVSEVLNQSTRNSWTGIFPVKQTVAKPTRRADLANMDYSNAGGFVTGGAQ